jgi:SBP domain
LQCSRFHPTAEFDGYRRTCRIRLAQHNTRRRLVRARQRADREASPTNSSGGDFRAPRKSGLPPRYQQVPHYSYNHHQQRHHHQQQQQQQQCPRLHVAPHHQPYIIPQLASRPANGNGADMHSALLEVALARLAGGDTAHVNDDARQPAVYNPHTSAFLPSGGLGGPSAVYRPPPIPTLPHIHQQVLHQHQQQQQQDLLPAEGVEALLNNVDPQQLAQMLQLIISLQQMGCSLDQLEHPEVLPLMMSLLQTV